MSKNSTNLNSVENHKFKRFGTVNIVLIVLFKIVLTKNKLICYSYKLFNRKFNII